MGNAMNNGSKELQLSGTFSVSVELMWEVWTEPKHLVNWWGPANFSATLHKFIPESGGEWDMTLHGPDGINYPNKSTFIEIQPKEKIVFEHFNPHFITTILFKSTEQGTNITWNMLFDTDEMKDVIVKAHRADEGLKQNMDKLGSYLKSLNRI